MAEDTTIRVTLVGAALTVGGYVGRSFVKWRRQRRNERAKIVANLEKLQSLLNASRELFLIQKEQVIRLDNLLKTNHPQAHSSSTGFDDAIVKCFDHLSSEERALHRVIRAYTEHSLRSVNTEMSKWLRADLAFKAGIVPISRRENLANQLFLLEIHLLLWHAKFESWIPSQPEHALVYMNDEQHHGLGFPGERKIILGGQSVTAPSVDDEVRLAASELRRKWG